MQTYVRLSPSDMNYLVCVARLYGRSRQCGRPVGAQWSMGLGQNPLINGLIKIKYFISRKI